MANSCIYQKKNVVHLVRRAFILTFGVKLLEQFMRPLTEGTIEYFLTRSPDKPAIKCQVLPCRYRQAKYFPTDKQMS